MGKQRNRPRTSIYLSDALVPGLVSHIHFTGEIGVKITSIFLATTSGQHLYIETEIACQLYA